MNGKILVSIIGAITVAVGVGVYYTTVHYWYDRLENPAVSLISVDGSAVRVDNGTAQAIDAISSPIRYRACFELDLTAEELAAGFVPYPDAEPLIGRGWFDCFDANAIGAALADGLMTAWLGQENIVYGIDKVIAVDSQGNGYAWHQINRCGELVFDGKPAPEGCPPKPED